MAYVGRDGNVYAVSVEGDDRIQVTDDATTTPEGQGRSYHRVSWSRDGQLAYAAVVRSENATRSELYVHSSFDEPGRLVAEDDQHFVIYVYWSPASCAAKSGCDQLAYLMEEADGVGLHVVRLDEEGISDRVVATGRPFYFSWSPDGEQLLWHTGGARRFNRDAEMGLYDLQGEHGDLLSIAPGDFSAPAWSPTDERWLAVSRAETMDHLQVWGGNEPVTIATSASGTMAFTWSPTGERVAYAVRDAPDMPFYGPIQLFNMETKQTRQLTPDALGVLGFFWAPDGKRIDYLTRLDLPNAIWMQWRVYDLVNQQDRGFAAFHPSPLMRFAIHSFGQYAQSHRFWSPDGRYLVYAERDGGLRDQVWLVDTRADKGEAPIRVDAGSFGVWSWGSLGELLAVEARD